MTVNRITVNMNTLRLPMAALLGEIVLSVFLTGCSSMNWPITPVEDIVHERKQRKDAALEEFDRHRDWAEFQAATNAWSQGDTIRCPSEKTARR